jgi:Chitin binding Peritrophin-A domain
VSINTVVPLQACINGLTDSTIPCAAIDPSKPFCGDGVCRDSVPGCSIPEPPLNIVCSGVGQYPDPADCSRYHSCGAVAANSQVINCPAPLLYNSLEERCESFATPGTCDYSCSTTEAMFTAYQRDPRFYFYCRPDASGSFTARARVMRCPVGHVYRGDTCSFECPAEGRFPDPTNPTQYYECFLLPTGTLIARAVQCPAGMVVSNGLCVVE